MVRTNTGARRGAADLESGKEYRAVRAGPEFTRKIMSVASKRTNPAAHAERPGCRPANIIAAVSALVIAGRHRPGRLCSDRRREESNTPIAIDAIWRARIFAEPVASSPISTGRSIRQWRTVGSLKLDTDRRAHAGSADDAATESAGGGRRLEPAARCIAADLHRSGDCAVEAIARQPDRAAVRDGRPGLRATRAAPASTNWLVVPGRAGDAGAAIRQRRRPDAPGAPKRQRR